MINMIKKDLLNLIKQYYIDMTTEIDDNDDEDEQEITIDTLKIDNSEEFFNFIEDYNEEIIYDYLSEKMKIAESEYINLEINYNSVKNVIIIEIQQIEMIEDGERLDNQISLLEMENIRTALLTGKFNHAQSIFDKYVIKENTRLVADKETSFFKREVPLKIENYEDIDKLETDLLTCIDSFEDSVESLELFEF